MRWGTPGHSRSPTSRQAGSRARSRARRGAARAATSSAAGITLAVLIVIAVAAVGFLWIATPPGDAAQLAKAQAAAHGIAYPGPPVPANFKFTQP